MDRVPVSVDTDGRAVSGSTSMARVVDDTTPTGKLVSLPT